MNGGGLSFDYNRDTWAVELGWQLGNLEFFSGNRNFDGTELGDQIRQRELDWTRAVKDSLHGHRLPPLDESYEDYGALVAAVFARLPDERLRALVRVGIAAARISAANDDKDETRVTLIASARSVLGQISPFHVADPDTLLDVLVRAQAKTAPEAAAALAGFVSGTVPAATVAFDYDRDLWAIELGIAVGGLEFAFHNHNFDGTELGTQVRASEREYTKQVDTVLRGRGLGALRNEYADFGELVSDVLSRLEDERTRSLLHIGVCVARLRLAHGVQGESQQTMLAAARQSLDGVSTFHVPDRDELFSSLLRAGASTAAEAGMVLLQRATPSVPEQSPVGHGQSQGTVSPQSNASAGPTAFISYARQDLDAARRLASDLRNAGMDIWIDVERIRPGERWRTAVSTAIESCRYFIPVLSSHSVSHRGYVQAELREALELLRQVPESETFVIPVRIDNAQIVNRELKELSWVDLFPDWKDGVAKLVAGLGAGSAEPVSSTIAAMDPGLLTVSLYLGWQLGRYEFIQGNELPAAQALEPELRAEIEGLLERRGDRTSLAGLPAQQAIRQTLVRALGRDVREHGAVMIGIAAFRVSLVGSSSDAANNEELKRLAFSALLDVDPSLAPNKQALFDRLMQERPKGVTALAELVQRQPSRMIQ
jgi:hypothetical protein